MEVTKRKWGISVKGTIRKNCYNCQAELWNTSRFGIRRFYFNYCRKCGKENNPTITKRYCLPPGLTFFLKWCPLPVLIVMAITIGTSLTHIYPKDSTLWITIVFTLLFLLAYLLGIFSFKTCPHCGNCDCYRRDHYCYNCGKPL